MCDQFKIDSHQWAIWLFLYKNIPNADKTINKNVLSALLNK